MRDTPIQLITKVKRRLIYVLAKETSSTSTKRRTNELVKKTWFENIPVEKMETMVATKTG